MNMKILVGDEFGLLKCIDLDKKILLSKYGEMKKKNGVIGISNLIEDNNNTLAVAHEQNFYVMNWNDHSIKSQPEIKIDPAVLFTSLVVKRTIDFSSAILARSDNKLNIFQYDEDLNLTSTSEVEIKTKKLQTVRDGQSTQEVFCLFKDTPISIFDLEKSDFSWRAKNVPNDELNLRVPIFDVDVAFSAQNNNVFHVSTGYGEIRTFDKKVKPRPVNDKKVFDRKINKMVISNCENYLTVGDTVGNIYMLDKRKNLTISKSLKGSTGSVRDIKHIKKSNVTLAVGLDRHLRVFDYKTNEALPQIYLKNKLNVIFPYEINTKECSSEGEEDESEDEEDELMEEGEFDEEDDEEEELEDKENYQEDEDEISEEVVVKTKKDDTNKKAKSK